MHKFVWWLAAPFLFDLRPAALPPLPPRTSLTASQPTMVLKAAGFCQNAGFSVTSRGPLEMPDFFFTCLSRCWLGLLVSVKNTLHTHQQQIFVSSIHIIKITSIHIIKIAIKARCSRLICYAALDRQPMESNAYTCRSFFVSRGCADYPQTLAA